MTIICNSKRSVQYKFPTEKDFEEDVFIYSKTILGEKTIYINAKKKIESRSLGNAVPDGFFFDFSDPTDPQFFIVEVELSSHSFFNHIFPQVTKFFAFFKNHRMQKSLVDKIFSIVNSDETLKKDFRKYLGQLEVYKFISDIIESSQNILLIVDGPIPEINEIMDTYTDTWGKMVRHIEIKKYSNGTDAIYSIIPDFETLQYIEVDEEIVPKEVDDGVPKYPEEYYLEGVNQSVKDSYSKIKGIVKEVDVNLLFNPQKYYVSIKANKNIIYFKFRNKKIRIIAMLPEVEIKNIMKHFTFASLSTGVQNFYNGPCGAFDVFNTEHIDEFEKLLRRTIEYNKNA